MSKRFGRNQKRKLMQQLKDQNEAIQSLEHQVKASDSRKAKLEWCIDTVRRTFGEFFAGLPASTLDVTYLPESWRIPFMDSRPREMEIRTASGGIMDVPKAVARVSEVMLHTAMFRSQVDKLSRAVHVQIRVGSTGELRYAISDETIRHMPVDVLAHNMAESLMGPLERLKRNLDNPVN